MIYPSLFYDKPRNQSFSWRFQKKFFYYDLCPHQCVENIRKQLNTWFARYPSELHQLLTSRFQNDLSFFAAFYELYFFGLFTDLSISVQVEPEIGINNRRPDFLLTLADHSKLVVEVTTNETDDTKHQPNFTIRKQIINRLERMDLGPFQIGIISLDVSVKHMPRLKPLEKAILSFIQTLNKCVDCFETPLMSIGDLFEYQDDSIYFSCIFFLDKSFANNGHIQTAILADNYDIDKFDLLGELSRKLRYKKDWYGNLGLPYIVCINFPLHLVDKNEVSTLLSQNTQIQSSHIPSESFLRLLRNSRDISALLISSIYPQNMDKPNVWIINNPFTNHPADFSFLPFNNYSFSDNQWIQQIPIQSVSGLFRLRGMGPFSEYT